MDMAMITPSWASSPGAAKTMRANRGRDTSLELRVRGELHRRGLRYRVDLAPLAGFRSRADIVFTRRRVAVYLDGCFWHGCPIHGVTPKAHADFWTQKLARNRERDAEASRVLRGAGWVVLRFWEHEDTAAVVATIESAVRAGGRAIGDLGQAADVQGLQERPTPTSTQVLASLAIRDTRVRRRVRTSA